MKNKLSKNDRSNLMCLISSNNLAVKIANVNNLLDQIGEVDLILIECKKTAKQLRQLKSVLNKAEKIASEINERFYNSF